MWPRRLGRWRLERDSELVVVRLPARLVEDLISAGEPCAGYVAMGQASTSMHQVRNLHLCGAAGRQ